MEDGFDWACSGVYGPNDDSRRGLLWDELVEIRHHWDIPWCCIGDFNVICFPSERLGCTSFLSAMLDFSQFIEDLSFIDLPLEGGQFTWFSGTDNPSMFTIDRALVSTD